jgi:two-component system chemotaxis response regulator CheY
MLKRVLAIDDSRAVRMLVGRHLQPFGVEVVEAENGEEGLAKARETLPHLILLDYNMPGMDGHHTLQCLKKDPNVKHIPVMMLTTEVVHSTVVKLIKLGLKDCINKPFGRGNFLCKVNKVLHLFAGDQAPPEARPGKALRARPGSRQGGNCEFLVYTQHIHLLRLPAEHDSLLSCFMDSMADKIPAELENMVEEGCFKLVLQLSPIVAASPVMSRKLGLLLLYAQRLRIKIRAITYSEKMTEGFRKVPAAAEIPVCASLEEAMSSFAD